MTAQTFISFASEDRSVAETVCKAVENRGLQCWIFTRDIHPGENFQESIVRAIRTSKVMILIFTEHSNNSNEVKKEIALASRRNLPVIPLRVEDVTPAEAFDYELATRQWIDAFDDWEDAIQRLIGQISQLTGVQSSAEVSAPLPRPAGRQTNEESPDDQGTVARRGRPVAPRMADTSSAVRDAAADQARGAADGRSTERPTPTRRGLGRLWIAIPAVIGAMLVAGVWYRQQITPPRTDNFPASTASGGWQTQTNGASQTTGEPVPAQPGFAPQMQQLFDLSPPPGGQAAPNQSQSDFEAQRQQLFQQLTALWAKQGAAQEAAIERDCGATDNRQLCSGVVGPERLDCMYQKGSQACRQTLQQSGYIPLTPEQRQQERQRQQEETCKFFKQAGGSSSDLSMFGCKN